MKDTTKQLNEVIAAARDGRSLDPFMKKILGLQTADKFRLTATLLDLGYVGFASTVGKRAMDEIDSAMTLGGLGTE